MAAKRGAAKKAARTKSATAKTAVAKKKRVAKPKTTLASIAEQLAALTAAVQHLTEVVTRTSSAEDDAPATTPVDYGDFESDLLATLGDLDRRGRHAGLVPIPALRTAFLDRGWSRDVFDAQLLQAERDFVVDLKTADDPASLANPELAIHERGRGHLQYAVAR
jgi:hypothetical protein